MGFPSLMAFLTDFMGRDIVFTRDFFQQTLLGAPGISMHAVGQPYCSSLIGYESDGIKTADVTGTVNSS